MTDAYTVIATGRARGLSERAIARQLGLRDGQSAYGITRMDFGGEAIATPRLAPPLVVRRPEPPKLARPQSQRGKNQHTRAADWDKAAAIKAAVEKLITTEPDKRYRYWLRQSGMFLTYTMAGLTLVQISELYGATNGDHAMARFSKRAVQARMNSRELARAEAERQKLIKAGAT